MNIVNQDLATSDISWFMKNFDWSTLQPLMYWTTFSSLHRLSLTWTSLPLC